MEKNKERLSTQELLNKASNVETIGNISHEMVEDEIPAYTLKDLSCEEWNNLAIKNNTKSYIKNFNREPNDYAEVEAWVNLRVACVASKE